jgi:hypothetical protein
MSCTIARDRAVRTILYDVWRSQWWYSPSVRCETFLFRHRREHLSRSCFCEYLPFCDFLRLNVSPAMVVKPETLPHFVGMCVVYAPCTRSAQRAAPQLVCTTSCYGQVILAHARRALEFDIGGAVSVRKYSARRLHDAVWINVPRTLWWVPYKHHITTVSLWCSTGACGGVAGLERQVELRSPMYRS